VSLEGFEGRSAYGRYSLISYFATLDLVCKILQRNETCTMLPARLTLLDIVYIPQGP